MSLGFFESRSRDYVGFRNILNAADHAHPSPTTPSPEQPRAMFSPREVHPHR